MLVVADRVLKRYKVAQEALRVAPDHKTSRDEVDALVLFKNDMATYLRLYTFLSQIFDHGNTAIEKRAIFYNRLLPLLEFGREREGIDLSKVVLTHHHLRDQGRRALPLSQGETPRLEPITEAGSGSVQEKEKARLDEIIEKVNDLFEGELSDQDKLVYMNDVIKGKLLESKLLRQQAANDTKEQFANSPDFKSQLLNAIMAALRKRYRCTKMSDHDQPVAANILDRRIEAERPNQRWVGDVTEILTGGIHELLVPLECCVPSLG